MGNDAVTAVLDRIISVLQVIFVLALVAPLVKCALRDNGPSGDQTWDPPQTKEEKEIERQYRTLAEMIAEREGYNR